MDITSYTIDNILKNMSKLNNEFKKSNERIATGKAINGSEDDPSNMIISSNLISQALSLETFADNSNSLQSVLQIADSAMSDIIEILEEIKSNVLEASQETLSGTNKKILQSSINSSIEALDTIARTTSFNDIHLLMGNLSNMKFQVSETDVRYLSIESMFAKNMGYTSYSSVTFDNVSDGTVNMFLDGEKISADLKYDNSSNSAVGLEAIVTAINDKDNGITAYIKEKATISNIAIKVGTLEQSSSNYIKINGVSIGNVTTTATSKEDLLTKINSLSDYHKVKASLDSSGNLTLKATDNNGISLDVGGTGTNIIASDAKKFGSIMLIKKGCSTIDFTKYNASNTTTTSSENITVASSGSTRLSTIDVTDYDNSQVAISVVERALTDMVRRRSDIGNMSQSLDSFEANINNTRINVLSAASAIQDIDFAEEIQNNNQLQFLLQTCSYAMRQAIIISEMHLKLLESI